MATLKEVFAKQVPRMREEIHSLIDKHGDKVISDVTVAQAYGGMRGVKAQVCDTSTVSPDTGLIIRGKPLVEVQDRCPEEIFWLLLAESCRMPLR